MAYIPLLYLTARPRPLTDHVCSVQSGSPRESSPQDSIISPFAQAPIHRSVGNAMEKPDIEMDIASVDKALDEVRPYLIADGGNVEVVSVEEGNVFLRLQGACGKTTLVTQRGLCFFRNVSIVHGYDENGNRESSEIYIRRTID